MYITLFFNEKKQDGDNLPLYQNGKVEIPPMEGGIYEVALWKKTENKNGDKINAVTLKLVPSEYWASQSSKPFNQEEDKPSENIPF